MTNCVLSTCILTLNCQMSLAKRNQTIAPPLTDCTNALIRAINLVCFRNAFPIDSIWNSFVSVCSKHKWKAFKFEQHNAMIPIMQISASKKWPPGIWLNPHRLWKPGVIHGESPIGSFPGAIASLITPLAQKNRGIYDG